MDNSRVTLVSWMHIMSTFNRSKSSFRRTLVALMPFKFHVKMFIFLETKAKSSAQGQAQPDGYAGFTGSGEILTKAMRRR